MKKPLQLHLLKRVPPACKGGEDHEVARGAADWRSGPRWTILSVLCSVHPFPLRGTSPQGETRDMREKTASHILQVPFRRFPPLVAGATTLSAGKRVTGFSVAYGSLRIKFPCHPRSSVGRQKESALMGRLGALLRPTWRSHAGPPQGHYKAPLCCELLMKGLLVRALFCPLHRGGKGTRFVRKRSDLRIV